MPAEPLFDTTWCNACITFRRFSTCSIIVFYFFCPVPLKTRLLPYGRSLSNLEHLNVQSFSIHLCCRIIRIVQFARLPQLIFRFIPCLPTMTSADFSVYYTNTLRYPPVRAFSFLRCLRYLHSCLFCVHRALQWCACLPKQLCLIYRSCSSVPDFAVPLPSVHTSR